MNRGVWVGTLALSLGAGLADLRAQESQWRPVARPPLRAPFVRAAYRPAAGAGIDRPVALPRPPGGDGVVQASFRPVTTAHHVVAAGDPRRGEVIATAGHVAAAEEELPPPELFAGDRANPPPPLKPSLEMQKAGNWSAPYQIVPRPIVPRQAPHLPQAPPPPPPGAGPAPPVFYLQAEYLLWWAKRDRVPVLASTSSPASQGFLDRPDTVVLFGGGALDRDPRSGGRFTAGYFLDDCKGTAVELGGFFLPERSVNFRADAAQLPVIARPFFNLNQQTEASQLTAFPGSFNGRLDISTPTELWGLESNLRCTLCRGCGYDVYLLGGARYLNLREGVDIVETIQGLPGAEPPFTNAGIIVADFFRTRNQFYGGQVGVGGRWRRGRWSVDGRAKVALGVTHQEIRIDGFQQITNPSGPVSPLPGGLLAANSNIGKFTRDSFGVVPEVGVNLGYNVTERVRAYVGYNYLFWSDVVRPGDQIDRGLDLTRIPNFVNPPGTVPLATPRPAVPFKESSFWAQGLVFGVEFTY